MNELTSPRKRRRVPCSCGTATTPSSHEVQHAPLFNPLPVPLTPTPVKHLHR